MLAYSSLLRVLYPQAAAPPQLLVSPAASAGPQRVLDFLPKLQLPTASTSTTAPLHNPKPAATVPELHLCELQPQGPAAADHQQQQPSCSASPRDFFDFSLFHTQRPCTQKAEEAGTPAAAAQLVPQTSAPSSAMAQGSRPLPLPPRLYLEEAPAQAFNLDRLRTLHPLAYAAIMKEIRMEDAVMDKLMETRLARAKARVVEAEARGGGGRGNEVHD